MESSRVVWITGLSGSGKSSLATALVRHMRLEGGNVVLLDGDELRQVFCADDSTNDKYNREHRLALAMGYARLCKLIAEQGFSVVIATISLFHEVHAWNRANLPGYFEVYLKVPLDELRRRDPKGLYQRFDEGKLSNLVGMDLLIDEPESPHWTVDFSPEHSIDALSLKLKELLSS